MGGFSTGEHTGRTQKASIREMLTMQYVLEKCVLGQQHHEADVNEQMCVRIKRKRLLHLQTSARYNTSPHDSLQNITRDNLHATRQNIRFSIGLLGQRAEVSFYQRRSILLCSLWTCTFKP